ncbi:MAG: PAS domain-containing sensor histidine kinase, partial [Ottowia sp.]|nr:PAS domain-containing sensor histidine kinase [Ottowia sp.]
MQLRAPADVRGPAHPAPARFWSGLRSYGREWLANFAPLAAVLLFLAAIASSFWYLRLEEVHREQEAVKRDVEYAQQRLRLRLLERQEQLMRLARDVANRDVDQAQFYLRAESLVAQYPELLSLAWIDVRRRVVAIQVSPSLAARRSWMDGQTLRPGETEAGYGLARDLLQPVYSQPIASKDEEPILQLHVPLLPRGEFAGELLTEYSVDGLLRYGVPSEVLAKYAVALLDAKNQMLAGQSIPDRAA